MVNCDIKQNWNKEECKAKEGFFQVIIPKGDNSKYKIKREYYKKYLSEINDRFGGSTIKPITLGCWYNEKKKLICEPGFSIEEFRDFDSKKEMKNFSPKQKKEQLKKDYKFLQDIAKRIGKEFGQWSVPVVYQEIPDVSLIPGEYKKRLPKIMTEKKIKGDLFKKYI